jgi:phenylacetate-CoA ligase
MIVPPGLARPLYWGLQRLRGRDEVRRRYQQLMAAQWRSPAENRAAQLEGARALVEHAYATVPYYRRVMDERGMRPADVATLDDLRRLPLLTRPLLLENRELLVSDRADRRTLQVNYSSGSTGVRAEFRQDDDFRQWQRALQLRTYGWCGDWRLGEPFALLWGSEIYWSYKHAVDRFEHLLTNRREFNTFRLSPELIERFLNALVQMRPVLVSTYANAIHLLAKEAERRGMALPPPRAVQAASEPLTPDMRETIRRVFGCPVWDKYGLRETGMVAHESPGGGGAMCVQTENVHVEFLRDDGEPCAPGEVGRVVLTSLTNVSMPLIRYETTDLAAPLEGACPSGRGFPLMSPVSGRLQDLIVTPDGGHIDAYFFSYLIMRFEEIHWFQVIQRGAERLHLRVLAPGGLRPGTRAALAERIRHHCGFEFALDVELLDRMPESPTGKFRLCVSELAPSIGPDGGRELAAAGAAT